MHDDDYGLDYAFDTEATTRAVTPAMSQHTSFISIKRPRISNSVSDTQTTSGSVTKPPSKRSKVSKGLDDFENVWETHSGREYQVEMARIESDNKKLLNEEKRLENEEKRLELDREQTARRFALEERRLAMEEKKSLQQAETMARQNEILVNLMASVIQNPKAGQV